MNKRGNGEGTIRRRDDGRWEVRVYGLDGRGRRVRQSLYGATQGDVQKLLRQRAQDNDLQIRAVSGTVLVKQYLTAWLRDKAKLRLSERTYQTYEQAVHNHISAGLGHLRLRELTAADIQHWVGKKTEKLGSRTVRGLFAVLRVALRDAFKMDVLAKDPTRAVTQPKFEQRDRVFLSADDARRFLAACQGTRLENLFCLTLALGLRIGEALGLQWSAVDLGDRSARIRKTMRRAKGLGFVFGEPKSKASRRTLDLPAMTVETLERQLATQTQARLAAEDLWQDWGLVFTTPLGAPLDHSNVTKEFKRILKAAGLPDMRLHDLRHSCASLLVAEGVNLKVVQDILGHSQISVTADTYAHVARPSRQDAASRIDIALRNPIPPSSVLVGVNVGVKSDDATVLEEEFLRFRQGKMVSPLGIEPRTNRLRVCCSTN